MRQIATLSVPLYVAVLALVLTGGAIFYFASWFTASSPYEVLLTGDQELTPQELQYGSWPAMTQPDFFQKVKETFIEQQAAFVEADLSTMRLRVYEAGQVSLEVPILTKGKPGSWWETPAGLYKIETREKNHFSTFGRVYQPWSMAFQGNFFVHGWPYYPGGAPVASTYSGGCIRLSTADARKVYDKVQVGMPILVYEKSFTPDNFSYQRRQAQLTSQHYLAADLRNNFVFAERASDQVVPVASLTKLVTALTAMEYVDIEKSITVRPEMLVPTSKPRLRAGESVMLYDLLYSLLNESSNEAAEAIAGFVGRERFISLMNQKAAAIGMSSSRFVDPAGVDAGNVSNAADLFNLAKYLYHNRSFVLKISSGKDDPVTTSIYGKIKYGDLENFNVFAEDSEFVGGKVGQGTDAQQAIMSIFETELNGATRPIVVIALKSQNHAADAKTLLSWVKNNY